MNTTQLHDLTLEQFLALPERETAFELVDGRAIAKVSPKYFHSSLQKTLLRLIEICCQGKGRILPEWAVILQRNGKDWVPTPDLTYVSYDRLPKQWKRNEACPVPCTLAIEIVSLGQGLEYVQPSTDYAEEGDTFRGDIKAGRILSPNLKGQTFAEFEEKARDYLNAGCDRVWVVEPEAAILTAFFPSGERVVYEGDRPIVDELLPGFSLSIV